MEVFSFVAYKNQHDERCLYTCHRIKAWNINRRVISPLKNSSNFLYDGTHGVK